MDKKYVPYVSSEDIMRFEADKPETHTSHPILNDILLTFRTVRPISTENVAKEMHISAEALRGVVMAITGLTLPEVRDRWVTAELKRLRARNPKISPDKIARALGFANRSVIWKAVERVADVEELEKINEVRRKKIEQLKHDKIYWLHSKELHKDEPERLAGYDRYIADIDAKIEKLKRDIEGKK